MRGHLRPIVDRAFDELWQPLTDHDDCPSNVFGEIYAGLHKHLRLPKPEYVKEDDGTIRSKSVRPDYWAALAMSEPATAETLLASLSEADFDSESKAHRAITSTYSVLSDLATDDLADRYLDLLRAFVDRYSLRYYVDEGARLWISFAGFATALFRQVRLAAEPHPNLIRELNAFERVLAECLAEPTEDRIKTTIHKHVIVLEAFGLQNPLISNNTLGGMLATVDSWPHDSLSQAARYLNKFVNDYPGIRHAGTNASAARTLGLSDLASVTLSLVGLVVYLVESFESQVGPAIQGDNAPFTFGNGAAAPWLSGLAGSMSTP